MKKKSKVVSDKLYRLDVEFYRIESELLYRVFQEELNEKDAAKQAKKFKAAGIGGRLVLLDGTPGGKVVEQWGSIERIARAEEIEKHALKR